MPHVAAALALRGARMGSPGHKRDLSRGEVALIRGRNYTQYGIRGGPVVNNTITVNTGPDKVQNCKLKSRMVVVFFFYRRGWSCFFSTVGGQ